MSLRAKDYSWQALRFAPFLTDVFMQFWAENDDDCAFAYTIKNPYFPNHILMTEQCLEPKLRQLIRGLGSFSSIFEEELRHSPYTPRKYVEMFLDRWAENIYHDFSATSVCLEALLESPNYSAAYADAAYRKNAPLDVAARVLVDNWDTDSLIRKETTHKSVFETRCELALKELDWDEETISSTPFRMKLEVLAK